MAAQAGWLSLLLVALAARGGEGAQRSDFAVPAAAKAFALLDADGSGKVSQQEVLALAAKQGLTRAQMLHEFRVLDTNGDGEIEPEEINKKLSLAQISSDATITPARNPTAESAAADGKKERAVEAGQEAAVQAGLKGVLAAQVAGTLTGQGDAADPAAVAGAAEAEKEAQALAGNASIPVAEYNHSMDSVAVKDEVYTLARKRVAEVFAAKAAAALQNRKVFNDQAELLEKTAKNFWGNATVLLRQATKVTGETASDVAGRVMDANMPAIQRLEKTAQNAENLAKAKHQIAEQSMHLAIKEQLTTKDGVEVARKDSGMPTASLLASAGPDRKP